MTRDHLILGSFGNLSDARTELHKATTAQYVARIDGVVLAFMSREGHSWRAVAKVPVEFRRSLYVYANINPVHVQESDDAEVANELYPPPVDAATEVASAL